MAELYDIFNDQMREVKQEDLDVLNLVYRAYGQVRMAKRQAIDLDEFQTELDQIHDELMRKVSDVK